MYGACKHRRRTVRELAPTVLWCSRCGAHKRCVDGRWLRWVPAGVVRMKPPDRQLELSIVELYENGPDDDASKEIERIERQISLAGVPVDPDLLRLNDSFHAALRAELTAAHLRLVKSDD